MAGDTSTPPLPAQGGVVWLTGLSGAGKTTIARAIEAHLVAAGEAACVLDGDLVRQGLCRDLGFSAADRAENVRRIGEVAALFARAGVMALVAVISPYLEGRRQARQAAPPGRFLEVHVNTPIAECERRDPKRLYQRARAGAVAGFTGVSAPYEPPPCPDLTLDTSVLSIDECVATIMALLRQRALLKPATATADT
jgi:adenylyl-sulfate kinase